MSFKSLELDKDSMKDDKGRYLTQSLFLEIGYKSAAIYTLDGRDKEYKGKTYPSLKRLYLEHSDPTEYLFAKEYLYDWEHWQRISNNSVLLEHIKKWREELALSIQADGISTILDAAITGQSYQAGKWLADKGWEVKERGRPSSDQVEEELVKRAKIAEEYKEDFKLLKLKGD